MEHDKIIFFRNFLFRAFIIGVAFGVFYFIITFAFWNIWASWVASFFKVDEKEFGRLVLVFLRPCGLYWYSSFLCRPWPYTGWQERSNDSCRLLGIRSFAQQAPAANPAMNILFHIRGQWRGVAD